MERLPYIDEHVISVDANRADTWSALLRILCRDPDDPATVPTGFTLDEATSPERFVLKGRHPFAIYRWVFELDDEGPERTLVRSATWAAFPGLHGKVYRALVIGTGGHRVAVRRVLRRIAAETHSREQDTNLPCDALVSGAVTRADRAISIDALPPTVFSWLCQLRVAPYSYDALDNLGRRSPRVRDPELVRLAVGQRFMTVFTLHSFVDTQHITLRTKRVAVTYAVRPQGAGTRLHVRVLFEVPCLIGRLIAAGDLVMMRKQLLTLKSLAEREARSMQEVGK